MVIKTEFAIGRVLSDDVIRRDQERVCDGDDGRLLAAVAGTALVARREGGPTRTTRAVRGEHERAPQPAIAFARASGAPLAGTFVLAGTQARPTADVTIGREDDHVESEFGHEVFSAVAADARNRVQSLDHWRETGEESSDLLGERVQGFIEVIQVGEDVTGQEGMMRTEAARECFAQGGQLAAEAAAREVGFGAGEGRNINLPLPPRTDGDAYLAALDVALDREGEDRSGRDQEQGPE